MDDTVQIRQRGTLTLPADLRRKYSIEAGDIFRLVDLDGIFVLTPMTPMVPELAREIEQLREKAGVTMDELLSDLKQLREQRSAEYDASDDG